MSFKSSRNLHTAVGRSSSIFSGTLAALISAAIAALTVATVPRPALATEGMWTPGQLPQIAADLKEAGLEVDPTALDSLTGFPMGAIVSLGGCSAAFVSPQGLVITNHHCVYGSIQYHSTAQRNLIRDGFVANSLAEELPAAPGSRVYVTVDVSNVTNDIIDARTAKLSGRKRIEAIEANEKRLIAACEKDAGHRCNVAGFYGGMEYQLIKQLELRDVRLVYAPPEGVGKFGGDTDNWMWPRHTGDFSFLRAYVNREGQAADFSRDNVPYQPAHHLKLAQEPLDQGDFVMVAGYPGRTNRHRLPSEIESTFGWNYPTASALAKEELDVIARATKGMPEAEIAYASNVAGINNGYKKRTGLLSSFAQSDLLERRQAQRSALKAWVHADRNRKRQYAAAIDQLEALLAERDAIERREILLPLSRPRLLDAARTIVRLAHEKTTRNDLDRKPGYQKRDWPRIREGLSAIDKRYDEKVDKALRLHFLGQYLAQPAKDQNQRLLEALGLPESASMAQVPSRLDVLYAGSTLDEVTTRLAWLDRDLAAIEASTDSFIKAAIALYADDLARENRDKQINGDIQRAYATYMKALIAFQESQGRAVYPDANGTLRVTYGKVIGRTPGAGDGTAWTAFTTLRGITAKHTGEGEFDAPDAQLAAIRAGTHGRYAAATLESVPVNFLATLDITGGNSGSSILNSRAELVGLIFDGTLDSVISDWDFDDARTRAIAVDLRYVLWQMEFVDQAGRLLNEMNGR